MRVIHAERIDKLIAVCTYENGWYLRLKTFTSRLIVVHKPLGDRLRRLNTHTGYHTSIHVG